MDLAETPDPSPDDADADSASSSGSWLQILANYATLLVAVSAVVLSVWQGYEMRKHNRLSVLPNLDVMGARLELTEGDRVQHGGTPETMTERSYVLKLGIENTGLGPAVFEKALLYRAGEDTTLLETKKDGDAVDIRDADSLNERMRRQFSGLQHLLGEFEQGSLMKAGKKQYLYEAIIPTSAVPDTFRALPLDRVLKMFKQYSFVACYCSVYGENCDQVHIGAEPPAKSCDF